MESKQTRLANLRQLIKREGAVSQLALRLQISPIYIYRVLDGKFTIGDSMARKIEDAYGFPAGWMDVHHDDGETEARVLPTLETVVRAPTGMESETPPPPVSRVQPQVAAPQILPPQERVPVPAPAVGSTSPVPVPTPITPASPTAALARDEDDHRNRLIFSVINALDRMLVANGLQLSDLERARLLMKAAETILDSSASNRSTGPGPKPVLKVTGPS